MIRTVILGADTPDAGELIRILAMHPEIEIVCTQAKSLEGRPLTSHHHGLIGESVLCFSRFPDVKKCDVIFDFSMKGDASLRNLLKEQFPDAKVIVMRRCRNDEQYIEDWTYGLPEIHRKTLVRDATSTLLPSPFASMALIALYPLARNLLLNEDLYLHISAPRNIIEDSDIPAIEKEIEIQLRDAQMSFDGKVHLDMEESNTRRSAMLNFDISCTIDVDDLVKMYDIYDDHHFAFATKGSVNPSEVAGTDKCVVALQRREGSVITISSVADCRMRGGAGEAVHVLNLMFGLHERTGLALKAIDFHPV